VNPPPAGAINLGFNIRPPQGLENIGFDVVRGGGLFTFFQVLIYTLLCNCLDVHLI